MHQLIEKIAKELTIEPAHAKQAIKLLFEEESTIPFVARYRKEMTGSMNEITLREVRDRYSYLTELESLKERYLKVIVEHCQSKPELAGKIDELRAKVLACETKQQLEDIYLPFKPKRRTRAQIARELGLEALANYLWEYKGPEHELLDLVTKFLLADEALKEIEPQKALQGASDIFAERFSENADLREIVRKISFESGFVCASKIEGALSTVLDPKNKKDKYDNYSEYKEPVGKAASHRVMAIRRGEADKVLRIKIEVDETKILDSMEKYLFDKKSMITDLKNWFETVSLDAYKRLLSPTMETEIRLFLKENAEAEAIKVFSKNLEKLLLLPPIPGNIVMGVDPGLRTGCKIAVVSQTGKYLVSQVVYPNYSDLDHLKSRNAEAEILKLIKLHQVKYIAIGNGTGSKEISTFIDRVCKDNDIKDVRKIIVNEAGASVYSTDDVAIEEFPTLDATIRSAISIARRLLDPLAELVKIEPRSVGVGQYQHDCNVRTLTHTLGDVVESCVNKVGIDVNTASYKLLGYVSGLSANVAKNIVSYRDEHGPFKSRKELQGVSGLGKKSFEQSAGFLRIVDGANILDRSAVHPERYDLVELMSKDLNVTLENLIGNKELVDALSLEKYVSDTIGMPTLLDISKELLKPGRDPRLEGARIAYSTSANSMEDLKVDMKMKGTVSNVTNFGVFVDIGVHQDGLVHISEMSDSFVKDPSSVFSVGDVIDVRVIAIESSRKRISLSCRNLKDAPAQKDASAQKAATGQRDLTAQRATSGSQERQPSNRPNTGNATGTRTNTGNSYSSNNRRPSNDDRAHQQISDRRPYQGSNSSPVRSNNYSSNPPSAMRVPPKARQELTKFSVDDLLSKFNSK